MMRHFPVLAPGVLAVFLAVGPGLCSAQSQDAAGDSASEAGTILLPVENTPEPIVTREELYIENYDGGNVKIRREINYLSDSSAVNHGNYEEFYKNGQKFAEGQYRNGAQHGEWTYWFENGTKCKTVRYQNGVPDGKWTTYWPDGKQRALRQYVAGEPHGTWIIYAEDGQAILEERQYEHGLRHGKWIQNYPSGELHVEEHYQQGQRHGKLTEWDEQGQVVREMEFKEGKLDGRLVIRAAGGTEIIQYYRGGRLVPDGPEAGAP